MKKILFLCVVLSIVFYSCKNNALLDLEESTAPRLPEAYLTLSFDKDSLNPIKEEKVVIDVSLTDEVFGDREVLLQTNIGSLTEIPKLPDSNSTKELRSMSTGKKVLALLHVPKGITHAVMISASISTSENKEYKVYDVISLNTFLPDTIFLDKTFDTLRVFQSKEVTAKFFSYQGSISDGLEVEIVDKKGPFDSLSIFPEKIMSTKDNISFLINSKDSTTGDVYFKLKYENALSGEFRLTLTN